MDKRLYYKSKQSKKCYARTPPGQLDVVRLARGKPDCWLKPIDNSEIKPKTLIFADSTIKNWTPQEQRDKRALLEKLMHDGFKIMIWQNGQIIPLDELRLFTKMEMGLSERLVVDYSTYITETHPDEIYTAVASEGLTPQNSFILDDAQLKKLLEEQHRTEIIDYSTCKPLEIETPATIDELISTLQAHPESIDLTIERGYGKPKNKFTPSSIEETTSIRFSNLRALSLHGCRHLLSSCLKIAPNLNELNYLENDDETGHELNFEAMPNLQYAKLFFKKNNIQSLNSFLTHTPNLKWLDIRFGNEHPHTEKIIIPTNSRVESLHIVYKLLSSEELQDLLIGFKHLKALRVFDKLREDFLSLYGDLRFPSITTLQLKMPPSLPKLMQLLAMFPNLSTLVCTLEPGQIQQIRNQYPHIGYIPLRNEPIAQAYLATSNHTKQTSNQVDTDTQFSPGATFHIKKIFFSPHGHPDPAVNYYRNDIFSDANIQSRNRVEFDLTKQSPSYSPCLEEPINITHDVYSLIKEGQYYGKTELYLTEEWQPLPSLSTTDKITHYHTEPTSTDLEWRYSETDNLYYVRTIHPKEIRFDFLISHTHIPAASSAIQELIDKYKSFGQGELILPPDVDNHRFLEAISSQKFGACRHRAVAFFLEMKEKYPEIPVRIIGNDCHMFVEIKEGEYWIQCDLGGYPATIKLDNDNAPPEAQKPPIEKVEIEYDTNKYDTMFETWRSQKLTGASGVAYFEHLLNNNAQKQLIECQTQDISDFTLALEHYAQSVSCPVIYLDSPEDIVCSAPYMKRTGAQGELCRPRKEGGGPLHDLLQKYRHQAPLIIVNYANFEADDIVRLNGLLDKEAHADGSPLPPRAKLVGIIDPNDPSSYQGADFYSRFDQRLPWSAASLKESRSLLQVLPEDAPTEGAYIIDLFHANDWRERLLGRWILDKDQLLFEEGELTLAMRENKPIVLQNPPDDPAFSLFWKQAYLRGYIDNEGERITFPKHCKLYTQEGYAWNFQQFRFSEKVPTEAYPLNAYSLSTFLSNYQLLDKCRYMRTAGLLANAKGSINIYVTHTLSNDEWDIFFKECYKYPHLQITLSLAPHVSLPESWGAQNFVSEPPTAISEHTRCIHTNDPDAVIATLKTPDKEWVIIDVTELSIQDLLIRLDAKLVDLSYVFSEKEKVLLTALKQNKSVILTGQFSKELSEAIASFLLSRTHQTEAPGELVLISNTPLHYMPMIEQPIYHEDKRTLLRQQGFEDNLIERLSSDDYAHLSFIECCTALKYLQQHPDHTIAEAWSGLERINQKTKLGSFNPDTSAQDAEIFTQNRCQLVDDILKNEPYVFLAGLTGVGKSSFVEKQYRSNTTRTLYQGEKLETLKEWASQPLDGKQKILFLDEANLSATHWSLFEGLFHTPPSVIIDGEYYPLTSEHKIIFAGNPLSYGDERETPRLFKRHANTVIFEPLSTAFIYEHIFKPVFNDTYLNQTHVNYLAIICFDLYLYLTKLSQSEVLISPREIQMLALLITNYCAQNPTASFIDIKNATEHYVYELGKTLVPPENAKEFDTLFNISPHQNLGFEARFHKKNPHFIFTQSRQPVLECLDNYLSIRAYRKAQPHLNPQQKYGGLGGLIIEGEPGIGKSDIVIKWLLAQGFKEGSLYTDSKEEHIFYKIPVSMELEAKKACLLKAFNEGAIVIIDEINSSPMMEQFLNALLMGKDPDGNPPQKPGFLLIGTQNPASMGGRLNASTALKRRLQTIVMPPYPPEEIEQIIRYKGMPEHEIKPIVSAFLEKSNKAKREHLSPAPVFRDLIKTADQIILAHHRAEHQKNIQNKLQAITSYKKTLKNTRSDTTDPEESKHKQP